MATLDTFMKTGTILRLSLPEWLQLRRTERPANEMAEDARTRRDFVLGMMQAHPEAFVQEESFRDMMHCISRR